METCLLSVVCFVVSATLGFVVHLCACASASLRLRWNLILIEIIHSFIQILEILLLLLRLGAVVCTSVGAIVRVRVCASVCLLRVLFFCGVSSK